MGTGGTRDNSLDERASVKQEMGVVHIVEIELD